MRKIKLALLNLVLRLCSIPWFAKRIAKCAQHNIGEPILSEGYDKIEEEIWIDLVKSIEEDQK
jgi:hypothetical protein